MFAQYDRFSWRGGECIETANSVKSTMRVNKRKKCIIIIEWLRVKSSGYLYYNYILFIMKKNRSTEEMPANRDTQYTSRYFNIYTN